MLPIDLSITTWNIALALGLFLTLIVIIFLRWWVLERRQIAPIWQEALTHIPLGAAVYGVDGKLLFEGEAAKGLLNQLPAEVIERAKRVQTHYATEIQIQEGRWVTLQAWSLGKQEGVLFLLRTGVEEQRQSRTTDSDRKFIGKVTHEMFGPLDSIGRLLDTIHEDRQMQNDSRDAVRKARKELDDLNKLVQSLRYLEMLTAGQPLHPPRLYKISDVAKEAVDQLGRQAQKSQISLTIEEDSNLPLVLIDRGAWREIFVNLIGNGIKYGKPGGAVRVEVRNKISELSISVADNGIGIPPEDLPHVFEETYRSKAHGDIEGNGLGLAIVELAVEQHGGQIDCESELGKGTTFYITLPIKS